MASGVEQIPAIWLGTAIGNFSPELYGDEYVSLQFGDRIKWFPESEINGWAFGRVSGRDSGWFPRDFVQLDKEPSGKDDPDPESELKDKN